MVREQNSSEKSETQPYFGFFFRPGFVEVVSCSSPELAKFCLTKHPLQHHEVCCKLSVGSEPRRAPATRFCLLLAWFPP